MKVHLSVAAIVIMRSHGVSGLRYIHCSGLRACMKTVLGKINIGSVNVSE